MENNSAEKKTSDTQILLNTQVIIIGAGPAGAGTSIFLTKVGIPHVVIEKENFPRDKICGDACSGKTVFVLRKANPLWPAEIFENTAEYMPSHGVTFVSPNGKVLDIPFSPAKVLKGQAPGFITPRLTFDNFLFQKLASPYAAIYQKATVKSMERQADGKVKVNFSHTDETYELTDQELTQRFNPEEILLVEKFNPERTITAIYLDNEKLQYNVKRFIIETTTLRSRFLFIKEGNGNILKAVSTEEEPLLIVQSGKGSQIRKAKFKIAKMVDVMGWKAVGAKLVDYNKSLQVEWEVKEERPTQQRLF